MSYCVNCGVELDNHEKRCPLCNTLVINPNTYGDDQQEKHIQKEYELINHLDIDFKFMAIIISIILLIPISVSMICNMVAVGKLTWSVFVIGATLLAFIVVLMPAFFKKKNIYVMEIVDAFAIALFLMLVNYQSGGAWFYTLALPLCFLTLIYVMVYTLAIRRKISALMRTSLFILFAGLYSLAVEILINDFNNLPFYLNWSHYVLIPCAVITIVLIFVDSQKKLKEEIKKRMFM